MKIYLIKKYLKDIFLFSSKDIFFLHNLRIFAVVMVIGAHIFTTSKDYFQNIWLTKLSKNFEFSVDILFVLSGFFSSLYFIKNDVDKKTIINFFIQKIIKILPIYILAFIIYYHIISKEYNKLLEIYKLYKANEINFLLTIIKTKLDYFWGDLLFISNYMPGRIINVGWNISAIVHYYLLFPFLIIFVNQIKQIPRIYFWIFLYILVTIIRFFYSLYQVNLENVYFYSHTRFDSFIVGVMISEILHNEDLKNKYKLIFDYKTIKILIYIYFLLSFYLIFIFYNDKFDFWNYIFRYNYYNVFLFLFILYAYFLKSNSILYKIFNFPYLASLSKMSYTLFLLHEYFAMILLKKISFQIKTEIDVLSFYIILLFFSFAIGYFFYLIFEQPFLMLKRNIKEKTS